MQVIEESFKITKTDIKSRSIFLSKENHIKTHFFVCFLSLLFLRIINIGLKRKFSIDEIKENIKNFNIVTITNSNIYEIINYNETIDEIRKFLKVEFGKKMVTCLLYTSPSPRD